MHPWRDRLNRWFEPLAERMPLSPNVLTVLALSSVLAGSFALAAASASPGFFLLALPFVAVGGLLDALDGIVARVQSRQSRFGDFLDHFCDRVADLSLVAGWCVGARIGIEISLLAVIAVSLNGYLGTQLEATWGRRVYEGTGRGEFVLALIVLPLLAYTLSASGFVDPALAGFTVLEWATLLMALFALLGVVQRFRLAIGLSS
jgi:archaetidylinositol phosphate synthase